ncbi:recombinase family protein [Sulfitobacter sp. JL08]|uniref:recombinase family protein n=1 Tax=Sulfitobacter sp. JL08 TaxID=2070369 RepID=UPI0013B35B6C|nr:recombinase family protein [Sulfitobacter sp. JL08]
MGGAVPMGYDVADKALVVIPDEATAIRTIFAEYLAAGSVRQLSARLDELGVVSKRRTNRHGRVSGGKAFSRGALYNMLRNPIYIGKTRHKEELHEGLHEAIIDDATWQLTQAQLADNGGKKISAARRSARRLLDGVLFDSRGRQMRTTYASKSLRQEGMTRTKRYWYYTTAVSGSDDKFRIERLPADEIDRVVLNGLREHLSDPRWLADQIKGHERDAILIADILRATDKWRADTEESDGHVTAKNLPSIIDRIDAQKDRLSVSVNIAEMVESDADHTPILAGFEIPFQKRQNGRAKPIVIAAKGAAQRDPDLIALVADARRWAGELLDGETSSIQQITEREGLRSGSVSRILPLAWLAPDISAAILEGRQPQHLNAKTLRNLRELPLDWIQQRQVLGFAQL